MKQASYPLGNQVLSISNDLAVRIRSKRTLSQLEWSRIWDNFLKNLPRTDDQRFVPLAAGHVEDVSKLSIMFYHSVARAFSGLTCRCFSNQAALYSLDPFEEPNLQDFPLFILSPDVIPVYFHFILFGCKLLHPFSCLRIGCSWLFFRNHSPCSHSLRSALLH